MPIGASSLRPVEKQNELRSKLAIDNCYFIVKLHEAQAFFRTDWLAKPGFITLVSSVKSTFQPNLPIRSLHRIETLERNKPCRMGLGINLTSWLPARETDSLHIELKYLAVRSTPIKSLMAHLQQAKLGATVSMIRPDWELAVKVSEIVGYLLSYFQKEGIEHEFFPLAININVGNIETGYHASVGSATDEEWPQSLRMDGRGRLISGMSQTEILNCCYAVLKVGMIPRRGSEIAREEPWWELLQTAKDEIIGSCIPGIPLSDRERRQLWQNWQKTLNQVRKLARKQQCFLLQEIDELIRTAFKEVKEHLEPTTVPESYGLEEFPDELQDLLGVSTMQELEQSVRNYQDALAVSRQLSSLFNT